MEDVRKATPSIDQSRMIGALRSRGLRIQRRRVRACLRRIYPIGTALRWNPTIYRRYHVRHPNALWHIDGNHKLIRWRLVIHACIDGFSRLVVYLRCANNNRALTVLVFFLTWGYWVWFTIKSSLWPRFRKCRRRPQYMLQRRGCNRGSILTGKSMHNVRVERLHRDVYYGVLSHYVWLFTTMEEEGVLDSLSETHLFELSLHFHTENSNIIRRIQKPVESHGTWNT